MTTDVLVIGGGISGLVTALAASQGGARVTLVDRATPGWAGQAIMAQGHAWVVTPEDDLDGWVHWQTVRGDYLNDQHTAVRLAERSYPVLFELIRWGLPLGRTDRGRPLTSKHPNLPDACSSVSFDPNRITVMLAEQARARGVRLMAKTVLVEPLLVDDRMVGAAGFDLVTGAPCVMRARATVLATGGGHFLGERLYRTSSGVGIALAYRAAARMRNAEFGNLYLPRFRGLDEVFRGTALAHVTNSLGESIRERYLAADAEDDMARFVRGMVREVELGRGPCQLDLTRLPENDLEQPRGNHPSNWERLLAKLFEANPDAAAPLQEVVPAFVGKLSPVAVDSTYRTSVFGLWAVGDTSHMGSCWEGALPGGDVPGLSISYALISAFDTGTELGRLVGDLPTPPVDTNAERAIARSLAPLAGRGPRPSEIIRGVQQVLFPVHCSLVRSGSRLEVALTEVMELTARAEGLSARDPHELAKAHEAHSALLLAEMTLRAALMRTESRGSHLREDCRATADDDWLRWIVLELEDHSMKLGTEPIPIDDYPHRPAVRPGPWDPPSRGRRPSAPPPSVGRRARVRSRPPVPPETHLAHLQLRGLDDQRVDLSRHQGTIVVLVVGSYATILHVERWTEELSQYFRLQEMDAQVVLYRLAVLRLPPFVPRLVVKSHLRRQSASSTPCLVAWDARERASVPVSRDDVPSVLVFDTHGWLAFLVENRFTEDALIRFMEQIEHVATSSE
ncbi:FAD-dependent oxidoreductase [Myxococcota bacterium]